MITSWGPCPPEAFCSGDANFDCVVGVDDLLEVLLGWGPCVDCNINGVPDDVDISVGTSPDCDDNDVPDECAVAALDCNANGRPDACDATFGFEATSLPLTPIGTGSPQVFAVPRAPVAVGDVSLWVTASADLDSNSQLIHVSLNGVPDGCDIAAGTSVDADADGIPDECG